MKKSGQSRRTAQEMAPVGPPPDKVGWVRQFCGRGLFREIWKNRYLFLRGERLWVSIREVKDERGVQHSLEMSNFDCCEELKKEKSRSKKSHSRFTLIRRSNTPNTVHNLVFLALSPEEKESWIQALNAAISRSKNRTQDPVLDQVPLEDGALAHPTRERVRVPPGRRLPSRGHLLAVASSSQGCLTLDLVTEEDFSIRGSWEQGLHVDCRVVGGRQRAGTDVSKLRLSPRETRVKTGSLPRASERNWGRGESSKSLMNRSHMQLFKGQSRTPQPGKKISSQGRNRCASMDEVLCSRPALIRSELRSALKCCPSEDQPPVGQLQSLIVQRMQRAQELLEEMRLQELQKTKTQRERTIHKNSPKTQPKNQNQSKPRSGGSGSPGGQSKNSPLTKTKKTKVKKDQTKSSLLKIQTDSSHGPHLQSIAKNAPSSQKLDQLNPSEIHSPTSTGPERELGQKVDPEESLESATCTDMLDLHQDLEEVLEEESDKDQDFDLNKAQRVLVQRAEVERLLQEALCSWRQAQEVLKEVRELQSQTLRRQRRNTYREQNQDQDKGQDQTKACTEQDQEQGQGPAHDQDIKSESRTESGLDQPVEQKSRTGTVAE